MKPTVIHRFASLAAIVALTCASAQTNEREGEPSRDIQGRVTLTLENSRTPVRDASRVVEWLVPRDAETRKRMTPQPHKFVIAQHNKSFQPSLLVVPIGAAVDFPNLDPWFHNVFSLYQGKRFDLGLYEAGSRKQVLFDRPGASYIFCNIHPQMHGVVLVVESEYFGISDKAGRVSISDVPPGSYEMHVWYEGASSKSLEALDREVLVAGDNRTLPPVTVATGRPDPANHPNKYGEDYDPKEQSPKY